MVSLSIIAEYCLVLQTISIENELSISASQGKLTVCALTAVILPFLVNKDAVAS